MAVLEDWEVLAAQAKEEAELEQAELEQAELLAAEGAAAADEVSGKLLFKS